MAYVDFTAAAEGLQFNRIPAWDGWQPREIDLGGGYASPRDPNTWAHGSDIGQPRTPAIEAVVETLRD